MTIQPESLANQLIDELGVFVNSGKTPSEFEIARFKKDADKLKKVDQAKSAMLHGMIIACFEGDFEACKRQHELSIRLNGSLENYLNYICSLSILGRMHDEKLCVEKALVAFPFSPELIKSAIRISNLLGFFDKVLEYNESLEKIQLSERDEEIEGIVIRAKHALNMNVPEGALYKLSYILQEILAKYKAKMKVASFINGDVELFHWIETSANIDSTVDMNFELCEILAETEDLDLGPVSVAFRACQQ